MNTKMILSVMIGALVIGGGSFYGGMQYGQSHASSAAQAFGNGGVGSGSGAGRGGRGFGGGQARGGGFISGEVLSKDATSVTVKLQDGGSKIIFYSSSTRVGKMTDGSMDDVAQGTNVTVIGMANADGSVTASNIQIRPVGQNPRSP